MQPPKKQALPGGPPSSTASAATDAELRQRVDALLKAHDNPGSFLDRPAVAPAPTLDEVLPPGRADVPAAEATGTVIGPYKLLQQIGEGGMGTVFMAEQTQPVQRKVALKVIKAGMDSRQVIARFEAERQALAMMDHVNIARVFDAGATEAGRPYFVMELVHGVPITKYCDDNHLTPRAAAGAVRAGLPGDPARPPEGDHPPRHQAVQRHDHALRRQAGAQGDRLRRGQGDRAEADRADAVHAVRHPGRHAGIHEPGAGGDERPGRRHAQRHLLAGRAPVRAADGQHAADPQAGQGGGVSPRSSA